MPLKLTQLVRALPAVLFGLLAHVSALAAPPAVPNAGSILQQSQPATAPAPSSNDTGLSIEAAGGGALPPSAPFLVTNIELTGERTFDNATLRPLIAAAEGKSLTLTQLGEYVARITDFYHSHGYPLARAIIPAQTIKEGRLRIEIIEARYGEITLDNHSRVLKPVLQAILSPLQSEEPIAQAPLNHALLLLSDVPGVTVVATLKPGDAVGTSDLQIEALASAAVTGDVVLDNDGNRYTGRARLGATANFIDPLQHGDELSLTGLSSGGNMNYASLSYESLLNGAGTRAGGSYSALHYILGNSLAQLDGHGTAAIGSFWAKQPLLRSQNFDIYGQLQYDHKSLDDAIDAAGIRTARHLDDVTANFAGDLRDTLLSGGVNTWSFGWTAGNVGFNNGAAELVDAVSARTQGRFSLWNASFSRLQRLGASDALYLALSGQWSNANLDPAAKMVAGGPYTVRAYDIGALSADTGFLASAEFRHTLGQLLNGPVQALGFIDSERVTINRNTWVAGPNNATLTGAGIGLTWSGAHQVSARASVATPVGSSPVLIGKTNSTRVWGELSKGF